MQHDPLVCIEDALRACKLIIQFTKDISEDEYCDDLKTKAAVEREFEIIGEALNRVNKIDSTILNKIDDWKEIIDFRNVISHGYDVVEDEIVWDSIKNDIPVLLEQLKNIIKNK